MLYCNDLFMIVSVDFDFMVFFFRNDFVELEWNLIVYFKCKVMVRKDCFYFFFVFIWFVYIDLIYMRNGVFW